MIKMIIETLLTQFRVVFALMMREVHTIYGKTKLGYLWAIIQTILGIAIMWGMRLLCHFNAPHGLSVLSYLVFGFILWDIISNSITKSMLAIDANRSLLTFPQVTTIDVVLGRCLVLFCTKIISGMVLLFLGYVVGYEFYVTNAGGLIYILFLSLCLGFGLGLTLLSLNIIFPTLERIIPIVFRSLMFVSGVFFSVGSFANRIGEWILWNPILQIIEFSRTCVSYGYSAEYVSHIYLVQVALYSLFFGLLLERYTRKRMLA